MPRVGFHYNLGSSRGPDKIGSRAGSGPRAVSCTWLIYRVDYGSIQNRANRTVCHNGLVLSRYGMDRNCLKTVYGESVLTQIAKIKMTRSIIGPVRKKKEG